MSLIFDNGWAGFEAWLTSASWKNASKSLISQLTACSERKKKTTEKMLSRRLQQESSRPWFTPMAKVKAHLIEFCIEIWCKVCYAVVLANRRPTSRSYRRNDGLIRRRRRRQVVNDWLLSFWGGRWCLLASSRVPFPDQASWMRWHVA